MSSTLKYERVDMQSAQVISKITDLSRIESTTPDYAAVAVITAPKGPMNIATLLETTDDLISTFGYPNGDFVQLLGVYKILESGVPVWVVRVSDPLFVNTSKALIPPASADTLFASMPTGFDILSQAKMIASRDDLLNTKWFSDQEESGSHAGEYKHAFPEVFFMPTWVKEEEETDSNNVVGHKISVIGVTETHQVNEGTEENPVMNDAFGLGVKLKLKLAAAVSELNLSTLKIEVKTVEADPSDVKTIVSATEVTQFMTDGGASLKDKESLAEGDIIEVDLFIPDIIIDSAVTGYKFAVTMTHGESPSPVNLADGSGTITVISGDGSSVTVIDAVGRFSMKEEGSYGDYNSVSVVALDPASKTVEIMEKTYPNADPDKWVNVRFYNSQTGLDDNIVCTLDNNPENDVDDVFIENVFSKDNADTVAVFDWLNEDSPMTQNQIHFEGGNDGNVNIEKEVVNIYVTVNEVTGEKQLVSKTSPAYGYIDESGNLSGMHVFLNKKIKAQAFPSLGLCDVYTYEGMKTIADEREDLNCFFDSEPNLTEDQVILATDNACNSSEILSNQAFNCRIFWDWCYSTVRNTEYLLPPSVFVTINSIKTWKDAGPWNPVAGYTYGVIDVNDVGTKLPRVSSRDKLVSHRINPIYDTGNHGIQIYGNETLNYEYTDLRSAHIASTLIYIRSMIDTYTETLKFKLNTPTLWNTWENYVTNNILSPLISVGALKFARARMGAQFTTAEELAKRQVRGQIELQFSQDAEIFLLNYVVYASSADTTTL